MNLDRLGQIAHAIAEHFGTNCEVIIHDLRSEDPEHTIVAIENGHVSNRKLGDGPSRIVLETLQHKKEEPKDMIGYLTKTHDGRILKSSTVFLKDANGEVEGLLSINYDITELMMAEHAIGSLLTHSQTETGEQPKNIPQSVGDLLDDLIEQSVKLIGKPVAMMNKEDKTRAIQFLNDSGAFLVTKSGDKVSKYFGISKYTLYSYIDIKASKEKANKELLED